MSGPHPGSALAQTTSFPAELVTEPLVFIDLETTGANLANDRIIEIGLVEVDADGVREWSSLVDPERPIPEFISGLTGIDSAMTATAPRFAELAPALAERLRGRLFVAHNARFDYGFLKREFARLGMSFRAQSLCTVKLSRRLYPQFHRHSLEALLERHAINVDARHRALADARVLWELWQHWCAAVSPATVWTTALRIVGRPQLPPQLDPGIVDDLPDAAGAFAFYDADGLPLHVARSANVRQQALSLFAPERREAALARATQRIEWREAAGELGARLHELAFIRPQRPLPEDLCAWRLVGQAPGELVPQLVYAREHDLAVGDDLYGIYATRREALLALRRLAEAHRLCFGVLGLGDTAGGEPCVAYRRRACRGACVGKESATQHTARLQAALERLRLKAWPYPGPVAIVERDEFGLRVDYHLVDRWRLLATTQTADELPECLARARARAARDPQAFPFDPEIYRLFNRFLHAGKVSAVPLDEAGRKPASRLAA
ncbi:3'-5' exonuclease family protein [Rhodocyclus purpureus]|uniref:3'-5' exonuclease family protein n=1 Tax=Rhodocyclus purpureus TaxID=1067 RepID=UPI0019136BE6|nr:3'-5' exonuclease family protein [Rhodocyclus purpureus]MBK5914685.1 hypothetical protein [Rhodocyclus purpureus]